MQDVGEDGRDMLCCGFGASPNGRLLLMPHSLRISAALYTKVLRLYLSNAKHAP